MKAEHWRELVDSDYDTLRMENDHCYDGEWFKAWVYNEAEDGIGPYYPVYDIEDGKAFAIALAEKWEEVENLSDGGFFVKMTFKRKGSIG